MLAYLGVALSTSYYGRVALVVGTIREFVGTDIRVPEDATEKDGDGEADRRPGQDNNDQEIRGAHAKISPRFGYGKDVGICRCLQCSYGRERTNGPEMRTNGGGAQWA